MIQAADRVGQLAPCSVHVTSANRVQCQRTSEPGVRVTNGRTKPCTGAISTKQEEKSLGDTILPEYWTELQTLLHTIKVVQLLHTYVRHKRRLV